MTTGGLPFILAETGARLVHGGHALSLRQKSIAEIKVREQMAREALKGFEFESHPHVPFLWLKLPDPWMSGTFKNAALAAGVLIDDEDEFKAARTEKVYHRVRIAFSSPQDRKALQSGFMTLRRLLENGSASYDSDS
jgi:DNA-binding transcriptional MocR family regulator